MRSVTTSRNNVDLESRFSDLEHKLNVLRKQVDVNEDDDQVNIICFSGEYDRLYAALTIAAGSLAMGMDVHLFVTFWAVNTLKKGGPGKAQFSRYNLMGLGKYMIKRMMKKKGVEDIEAIYNEVLALGVHIHLCDTTAELFGVDCKEINGGDNVDRCGVATFLSHAMKSKMVLFV